MAGDWRWPPLLSSFLLCSCCTAIFLPSNQESLPSSEEPCLPSPAPQASRAPTLTSGVTLVTFVPCFCYFTVDLSRTQATYHSFLHSILMSDTLSAPQELIKGYLRVSKDPRSKAHSWWWLFPGATLALLGRMQSPILSALTSLCVTRIISVPRPRKWQYPPSLRLPGYPEYFLGVPESLPQ